MAPRRVKVGPALIVVLMGVSGCGKSTVAAALHARLDWPVCEGDDLHPPANVAKMAAGTPLTDADRAPWLQAVRAEMDRLRGAGSSGIVTCSALHRSYRDVLRGPDVLFALLDGPRALLLERVQHRHGHFMPVSLLDSQLAELQRPDPDENAITVSIEQPLDGQVDEIVAALPA